jgi:hypothetical protein
MRARLVLNAILIAVAWLAGVYLCWAALANGWFSSP